MSIHQDWIMRQIEMLAQFIAHLLFGKDKISYEIDDLEQLTRADRLHSRLLQLLTENKINEAEDTLFRELETDDRRYLELAVDFYLRLNALPDTALSAADFSRDEIQDGLQEIASRFGISLNQE